MVKRVSVLAAPLLAILLGATACGPGPTAFFNYDALKDRCRGSFRLEAGDVVRVNVWNEPNHSRDQVLVRPDGKISLPLLGDIVAAGSTITQLSHVIRDKVQAFVPNPRVDVSLVSARSYQIYVMGEVHRSGTFTPQSPVNVVQALSLAGGFTAFAKQDQIWIVWNSPQREIRIPFNYEEVLKGENLKQNIMLCRGDIVLVP